jgi:hypothetical protein
MPWTQTEVVGRLRGRLSVVIEGAEKELEAKDDLTHVLEKHA